MATQYVKDDSGEAGTNNSGATFIPASQRPDGTWRKARRVKEGYVPQEEMPLYESKGKQWAKNKPTLPPGLHPDDVAKAEESRQQRGIVQKPAALSPMVSPTSNSSNSVPVAITNGQSVSKAAKKNAKRKEKKKEKQLQGIETGEVTISMQNATINDAPNLENNQGKNSAIGSSTAGKRLKNLKKKLREIELLKEKIANGQLSNPDKDQLQKLAREAEIEQEMEELELHMDN